MRDFYFIAEIGQNHQGDLKTFKQLIDVAADCGADAVKSAKRDLGSFPSDLMNTPYRHSNSFGRTYGEHRKALELSKEGIMEMARYAYSKGLDFGMSFTDMESLHFLLKAGLSFIKIPSSQITNIEALKYLRNTDRKIYLSTGMADIDMVDAAVDILDDKNITIMQCTSSYPAKEEDLNLSVITEYLDRYPLPVGFSGHHVGIDADIIAKSLGATVFERHITLSRSMKGSDHIMSLEPSGLQKLIRNLTRYKDILGSSEKRVLECEYPAINKLRRHCL